MCLKHDKKKLKLMIELLKLFKINFIVKLYTFKLLKLYL